MTILSRLCCFSVLWGLALGAARADEPTVRDNSFFGEKLYPVFRTAQCERCHNDNGVASETELRFPREGAAAELVETFGLKLLDLIEPSNPEESLLYLKPTNREEHSGGARIKPGSDEEQHLLAWIRYLAGLSAEQVKEAREKIAQVERLALVPLSVRRLTHLQYNNSVRDLLNDQTRPADGFPKEDFINGFKNQIAGQGISPILAEAYGIAAERLAARAFRGGDHLKLLPRAPQAPDDAECAREFVQSFGRRAFRRPLTGDEVTQYVNVLLRESQRSARFTAGAQVVVEAMLQSPHFLFRIERGPGGDFEAYEVASRLSYLLWDTMPDAGLLQMAEMGGLSTREQIETQARHMLNDPRARGALDEFLAQWMRFDRVLGATRDRRRFSQFNADLAGAMVEETRRLFHHLVWSDASFMEFFTADYTFVNADLARLYGLPEPTGDFARVSYPPDSGRAGVLGHASFLTETSNPAETSPTSRGLFVRNQFLSHDVPAPPPGINAALPELTAEAPLTNRQRLDLHLNSESCAGCHRLVDPIGLGFEQYNAIGGFEEKMLVRAGNGRRGADEQEVTLELDTSAYVQGLENSNFTTPRELGRVLAESRTAQRSIVKQLFRYAFGREETDADQPALDALLERFRASGYRFRELLVAIVTSDLFLQRTSR